MAAEAGLFRMEDVLAAINGKMIRSAPHVFGKADIDTASAQTVAWEAQKAAERAKEAAAEGTVWLATLDGSVTGSLPSPGPRSCSAGRRESGSTGRPRHRWLDKVRERNRRDRDELDESADPQRLDEEVGDLLFARSSGAAFKGRCRGCAAPGKPEIRASIP